MHYLDLGLFNYQVIFTYNLLKDLYGSSIIDNIDNRLANILRYPELKIFKNRIQSLFWITANKYQNLMKVIIFVLDNLNISDSLSKKLLNLYESWNNIYLMSRYEEYDENELNQFEVSIIILKIFEYIRKFLNYFNYI